MKSFALCAALVLTFGATTVALSADNADDQAVPTAQAGETHTLHGVVNSINTAAGRVNITHDSVESLKWPKMKMNFKAQDPALLETIKPGMEVDFEIRKMDNEYRVTKITPAK